MEQSDNFLSSVQPMFLRHNLPFCVSLSLFVKLTCPSFISDAPNDVRRKFLIPLLQNFVFWNHSWKTLFHSYNFVFCSRLHFTAREVGH